MIPILYEKTETAFDSNGLGRLRDCISCVVSEGRNDVYECDFVYPTSGAHFDDIILGRIIGVEHDCTNDVQPFDIVSYSRPIDGKVTFHAVHISYRLSKSVVTATSINSLDDAFNALSNSTPSLGFSFTSDKSSSGFVSAFDGVPKSVRTMLGGVEGSILDAYGGEYEFNRFNVTLWDRRGIDRNLTIRYGLNMTEFNEDADYSDSYNACIGYWKGSDSEGNDEVVMTDLVESGVSSYNGRTECVALDLTDKFEDKPSVSDLTDMAQNYMTNNQTYLPSQTITVDFINLRDTLEYQHLAPLFECNLCDTVNVVFPRYDIETRFKVVKTEYDVLLERYSQMELGQLSMSLSEALGITSMSSELNGIKDAGVIVDEVSVDNLTVSSYVQNQTLDASKSGYVPIGIVGWRVQNASSSGANASYISIFRLELTDATTITYAMRNHNSSDAKVKLTAYVLYRKN